MHTDAHATPFPELNLPRCNLRAIGAADIDAIYTGLSHPRVIAHYGISYDSLDATQEQMRWYERLLSEQEGIWWGMALPGSPRLIGACGFNDWDHANRGIELGYWLMPEYWGQGLLQHCLPHVLRYALQHMQLHRIHADVEPENIASVRLLQKMGFVLEGTLRDIEYKNGRFLSLHQYSLLATDPAARALLSDEASPIRHD